MADSILSSVLSKAALSIVAASDPNGANLAERLKVVSVTIKYRSRTMRHMKEDGNTVVDVRIIDPASVELDVIAPTFDELGVLRDFLLNRKNTCILTSKGLVVNEVICGAVDVKQSAEMLSASPAQIRFKQLLRQGGPRDTHKVVEQSSDSSVFNRGYQTVTKAAQTVQQAFIRSINTNIIALIPNG
jgi:hypothetical protein